MPIQPLPLLIFRHHPIQAIAHILPHVGVPILVQRQCRTCVLQEQMQQPTFYFRDIGNGFYDVFGDEVRATAEEREGNSGLGIGGGHGAGRKLGRWTGFGGAFGGKRIGDEERDRK